MRVDILFEEGRLRVSNVFWILVVFMVLICLFDRVLERDLGSGGGVGLELLRMWGGDFYGLSFLFCY